jgi:hypothetical protein
LDLQIATDLIVEASPLRQTFEQTVRISPDMLNALNLAATLEVSAWQWEFVDASNHVASSAYLFVEYASLVLDDASIAQPKPLLIYTPASRIGQRNSLPLPYAIRLHSTSSFKVIAKIANYRDIRVSPLALRLSLWCIQAPLNTIKYVVLDSIGVRVSAASLFPTNSILTRSFEHNAVASTSSAATVDRTLVAIQWHCHHHILTTSIVHVEPRAPLEAVQSIVHQTHLSDTNVRQYRGGEEAPDISESLAHVNVDTDDDDDDGNGNNNNNKNNRDNEHSAPTTNHADAGAASSTGMLNEMARFYPFQALPSPDNIATDLYHLKQPLTITANTQLVLSGTASGDVVKSHDTLVPLMAFLYVSTDDPNYYPLGWDTTTTFCKSRHAESL